MRGQELNEVIMSSYQICTVFRIKLVKIFQELTESEPKADPKRQRERWTGDNSVIFAEQNKLDTQRC